jgi:hypothetical protein
VRRLIATALAAGALMVATALPASAQQTPVSYDGPVTAGSTLTLTCPAGTQVQVTPEGVNASLSFYRTPKRKSLVAGFVPPTSTTSTTASWLVPKGAKYAQGTLYCEPITTQTLTGVGQATGAPVTVNCPPETPYLVSVTEVLALDPAIGQWLSTPYTTTATGVIIAALPPSYAWRVTVTCSSAPQ